MERYGLFINETKRSRYVKYRRRCRTFGLGTWQQSHCRIDETEIVRRCVPWCVRSLINIPTRWTGAQTARRRLLLLLRGSSLYCRLSIASIWCSRAVRLTMRSRLYRGNEDHLRLLLGGEGAYASATRFSTLATWLPYCLDGFSKGTAPPLYAHRLGGTPALAAVGMYPISFRCGFRTLRLLALRLRSARESKGLRPVRLWLGGSAHAQCVIRVHGGIQGLVEALMLACGAFGARDGARHVFKVPSIVSRLMNVRVGDVWLLSRRQRPVSSLKTSGFTGLPTLDGSGRLSP